MSLTPEGLAWPGLAEAHQVDLPWLCNLLNPLVTAQVAVPMQAPPFAITVRHRSLGRRTVSLRPVLRLGRGGTGQGVLWVMGARPERSSLATEVMEALLDQFPDEGVIHLVLFPLGQEGGLPTWALRQALYFRGEASAKGTGMVLGPFDTGWECGSRYLLNLAETTQALEGQALRQVWREGLRRQALVGWIEEELIQQAGLDPEEARLFLSLAGGVDRDGMGITSNGREELQRLLEEWAARDPVLMCQAGVIYLLNRPRSRALLPWIPIDPAQAPFGKKLRVSPSGMAYREDWGADFFKTLAEYGQLSQSDQIQAAKAIADDPNSPWAWRMVASVHWSVERIALGLYREGGPEMEDLIQEGLLGANRATQRYKPFDAGGGFAPFHLYAWRWIWQYVNAYVLEQASLIRRPTKQHDDWQEVSDAPPWDEAIGDELPSWFCLSPVMGLDEELDAPTVWGPRVSDVLTGWDNGLDGGRGAVEEGIPLEVEEPESITEATLLNILGPLLQHETLRKDFDLLASHFGFLGRQPRTLEEIGASLDPPISRERVRQREARFIERIKAVPGVCAQLRGFYDNSWNWDALKRADRMARVRPPRKAWTRRNSPPESRSPSVTPIALVSEVTHGQGLEPWVPCAVRSFSLLDPAPA